MFNLNFTICPDEKHINWIIAAVVKCHRHIPDITLDIYGEGVNRQQLQKLIEEKQAGNYIRLMGQHDLTNVYEKYDAYLAASTSEGFGLSLLEAVGSGLPMIGYDVPYGNQTFIDDGQNGYLVNYNSEWSIGKKVDMLVQAIEKLLSQADLSQFSKHSYKIAEKYLTDEVANKWEQLLGDIVND